MAVAWAKLACITGDTLSVSISVTNGTSRIETLGARGALERVMHTWWAVVVIWALDARAAAEILASNAQIRPSVKLEVVTGSAGRTGSRSTCTSRAESTRVSGRAL